MALADDRPKGPDEDGTKPALTRIAGEGMMNSHAFEYLTELSDDIGSRVTGESVGAQSRRVGRGEDEVHRPGKRASGEVHDLEGLDARNSGSATAFADAAQLHIDAMGWTGSTVAGGVEGDVVTANMFDIDEEIKHVSRFKNKIVLVIAARPAQEELS